MANFMEFFRNRKNGRGSSTWLPYMTESWWGYRSWQSYAGVTVLSEEMDKQALETIALLVDLPKKKFDPGSLRYSLHKHAEASLNSGINLREAVRIPPGECYNDWLAVHVVDFFNRINLIYGTVTDFCTPETCPTMSGGPKYEYRWADGAEYKKPTPLPATQYITLLMEWVESQINNEDIFPVKSNIPFPKNFGPTCKKILTRLFRVFVHVYIHHFERLVAIGAEAHVNMCYKHFYYFVTEFDLVNQKELEPLAEMTKKVCKIYSPSK